MSDYIIFYIVLSNVFLMYVVEVFKKQKNTICFLLLFELFVWCYYYMAFRATNIKLVIFLLNTCELNFEFFANLL